MAKFDAGSVVDPLDYVFEKFAPGCNGRVREPTDLQIAVFFRDLRMITAEARRQIAATGKAVDDLADAGDPGEAIAALNDTETVLGMHRRLAEAYAALCSGEPSAETLLKLPMRIRTPFYQWLQGEVMNPEAAPGGGSAQVTTLRSAAAG